MVNVRLDRFEYDRRVRDLADAWGLKSVALYHLAITQIVWLGVTSPSSRVIL